MSPGGSSRAQGSPGRPGPSGASSTQDGGTPPAGEQPTAPSAPGQTPPKRERRGCLLYGCGAAVLLLVLGSAGAFLAGKWYLQRKYAEWVEGNPWAGALGELLEDAGEGSEEDDEPMGPEDLDWTGDGAATASPDARPAPERRPGVDDRSRFPRDVPLYPEVELETFSVGDDHAAAYQETRDGYARAWDRMRARMQEAGWSLDHAQQGEGMGTMLWSRGERQCQIDVVDGRRTEIWTRCAW